MKIFGGKYLLVIMAFIFIILVLYTIWDNNRIKIVEQEIIINNLPEDLNGFTILQITDLHEKEFGSDQRKLIEKINSIEYDAIVFTGDLLDSETSTNFKPIFTLLEGIKNKEVALFVPGNSDPQSYTQQPYKKSEFIQGMEKRGIKLLETIYPVQKGRGTLFFVDFERAIQEPRNRIAYFNHILGGNNQPHNEYIKHQINMFEEVSKIETLDPSDVLIGLHHYPVVDARIDHIELDRRYVLRDFDLIIAGHYHGGQIRFPFLGALFIPEAWSERKGFFPPQDRVKGLWEYKGIQQYVSAGLGSSDAITFLKFRFLNPPEINLLILKSDEIK